MEAKEEPKVAEGKHNKEKSPRKEPKEKRPRPERKNEYEYNPDLIDENTVIPPLPKKNELIKKPDIKEFKQREARNKGKIKEIIEKKKAIRAEKFKFNRVKMAVEGDNPYTEFNNEIIEVQQLRQKITELNVERKSLRERLHEGIEESKANRDKIRDYKDGLKNSREYFAERLEDLEHRLITAANLSKTDERNINNEITEIKRKLQNAESAGNIEVRLQKCLLRREELDEEIEEIKKEKEPIDAQFKKIQAELDKRNEHITGLKGKMSNDKSQRNQEKEKHDKEYEDWKAAKQKRLDKLEDEIAAIKKASDTIWDEFHEKQESYWQQKQLIDFIEWQNRTKNRKVKIIEREKRQAEYEKREEEREKEEKMKRFLNQIELINFLVNYLNNLKPSEDTAEKREQVKLSQTELNAKLASDAQWKKEKGLEVLASKKSKDEDEPEKKHKKHKKKKEKEEVKDESKFAIPFAVQNQFESIGVLAPASPEEIQATIKELKDRQELFLRVSREEGSEADSKLVEELKGKQSEEKKKEKKEKKVKEAKNEEDEFPTI